MRSPADPAAVRPPLRLALLSRWHVHADDYARDAREAPETAIGVVWDEDHERGRAWAAELGARFEADLGAVLADPAVDGVVVTTATAAHGDVVGRAVRAGRHVFSEKVLSDDPAEARALLEAAEAAGVRLLLSLPRLTDGAYRAARRVVDEGRLGRVVQARVRVAHEGALAGWLPERFFDPAEARGGAMLDLGAHPIYLTNRLLGLPDAVSAHLGRVTGRAVDDHSAVLAHHDDGAYALIETGFATAASPFALELHGTAGAFVLEDQRARVRSQRSEPWREVALPEPGPNPLRQWARWILHGEAPSITREDMLGLTRVNAAAAVSEREGRRVRLEEVGG